MSIVPSPGQMGPGTGSILMKHPTLFKGLGMGPSLTGLGTVLYLADLQSARQEGFGNDVQAYRLAMSDKITARYVIPFASLLAAVWNEQSLEISSGGGGPGESPISTEVPPSIEETGEILSNPTLEGLNVVPTASNGGISKHSRKKSRKSCPPGYRWNGRRCVKKG
jgi:hypothetical protein